MARIASLGARAFGPGLEVRSWRLGNGLGVLTLPDASAPVVSYQTWFGVGAKHDPPGRSGLAHFFEHLMFLGTERFPAGQLDEVFEAVGADNNAMTSSDSTAYLEALPAAALPLAIEVEADRMAGLVLDPAEVERERDVVLSERRDAVEDDVAGRASEALWRTAFRRHPYGVPILGWAEDVRRIDRADLRAFYRARYAPANATVVVAGDFDEATLLASLQDAYGALPPGEPPPPPPAPEPGQRRERRVTLEWPTPAAKLHVGWRAPAYGHPVHVPLTLFTFLLFGGRSARARQRLVRDRELVTEVEGNLSPFAQEGLYELWLGLREGVAPEAVLAELDALIAEALATPLPHEEVEKARRRLRLALLTSLETAEGRAERAGLDHVLLGDPAAVWAREQALARADESALRAAARRVFRSSRRTVVTVLPERP
ncbi:MAG: pitrilysin family protein [Myxococcota bacterium]